MSWKTKIRHFFIREGLLNPKSIKEAQAVFNFPPKLKEHKNQPIGIGRHMENWSYGRHR